MENTHRPWSRTLYLAVLAVGVVLVAAAFSWAANSVASSPPSQSATPSVQQEMLPIQDTQTTPTPPDGDRGGPGGGDREDCPEHDGTGGGSGSDSGSGSAAPQSAPTASDPGSEV